MECNIYEYLLIFSCRWVRYTTANGIILLHRSNICFQIFGSKYKETAELRARVCLGYPSRQKGLSSYFSWSCSRLTDATTELRYDDKHQMQFPHPSVMPPLFYILMYIFCGDEDLASENVQNSAAPQDFSLVFRCTVTK